MEIKCITVGALPTFIETSHYKNAVHCPITPHRAISQSKNPRAAADDPALLLAIRENEMVGYIGLLPDLIGQEKVYWNSGWWTSKEHREVAMPLFFQFIKKANKKILLTEMPEHTAQILKKLKFFEFREMAPGKKWYIGIDLKSWIPNRFPFLRQIRPLWEVVDAVFNTLYRNLLQISNRSDSGQLGMLQDLSIEDKAFIEAYAHNTLNSRRIEDLLWIKNNPWVLPKDETQHECSDYYFTATAEQVSFAWYRLKEDINIDAIALVRIINGHLFVPYFFIREGAYEKLADALYNLALQQDCITILIYDLQLQNAFSQRIRFSIFKKSVVRNFAYHKTIASLIPEEVSLQDGDGDVAFC